MSKTPLTTPTWDVRIKITISLWMVEVVDQKTYREQSRVFLEQASIELANGDLYQASEKGWGAAAQIVKAVASQRGWEHSTHSDLFSIVDRLVKETGNDDLRTEFGLANQLHKNFYEGTRLYDTILHHLFHTARFVDLVEDLLKKE